jgi:hypothetical protein
LIHLQGHWQYLITRVYIYRIPLICNPFFNFQLNQKCLSDKCSVHSQDTSYLKNVKFILFLPNCTSIFQSLDQGIIGSFKPYYYKQPEKTMSITDHKLLHDATLIEVIVLGAQHFITESWCCVNLCIEQ